MNLQLMILVTCCWFGVYATYWHHHDHGNFHYSNHPVHWHTHQHVESNPPYNHQQYVYQYNPPQTSNVGYHYSYPQQQQSYHRVHYYNNAVHYNKHHQYVHNYNSFQQQTPTTFVPNRIVHNRPVEHHHPSDCHYNPTGVTHYHFRPHSVPENHNFRVFFPNTDGQRGDRNEYASTNFKIDVRHPDYATENHNFGVFIPKEDRDGQATTYFKVEEEKPPIISPIPSKKDTTTYHRVEERQPTTAKPSPPQNVVSPYFKVEKMPPPIVSPIPSKKDTTTYHTVEERQPTTAKPSIPQNDVSTYFKVEERQPPLINTIPSNVDFTTYLKVEEEQPTAAKPTPVQEDVSTSFKVEENQPPIISPIPSTEYTTTYPKVEDREPTTVTTTPSHEDATTTTQLDNSTNEGLFVSGTICDVNSNVECPVDVNKNEQGITEDVFSKTDVTVEVQNENPKEGYSTVSSECGKADCLENTNEGVVPTVNPLTADLEVPDLEHTAGLNANTIDIEPVSKSTVPPLFWRFGADDEPTVQENSM